MEETKLSQEEITARIKASQEKYAVRKAKQAEYDAMILRGRTAVHEHRDNIIIRAINEDITFAAERAICPDGQQSVIFSFAFRKNGDTQSYRIAKGILGNNLLCGKNIIELPFNDVLFALAKVEKEFTINGEELTPAAGFLTNYAVSALAVGVISGKVCAPLWARELIENQVIG